ncbi:NADPH-dependent FMN reductase [Bogoriella caseilytica]|uniref:NAD(P)H-dependent FMN reductase n=1 Tax=Bogoriella caseilytica TaxID=56055 RepID=A0A3N2BDL5_9MICO|nr:NAD(P)H-dependent oxidoreductase [Bogoriella caseilytica]ROR73325.1 NAD(P)H-dependent FMN reductase [Bogoriella caseilytica]
MPTATTPDLDEAPVTTRPLRTLVVIGSTRKDRFGTIPAAWISERATARTDLDVEVVDLAALELPVILPGDNPEAVAPEAVRALGTQIGAADAVIIVTPVYNRGYPASLKNAIDWFYGEWHATPVGFVSYGGRTGGIEAVAQLRTVFTELDTMTIRDALTIPNFWTVFDDAGRPHQAEPMNAAATSFLDQLAWWAHALRSAKESADQ